MRILRPPHEAFFYIGSVSPGNAPGAPGSGPGSRRTGTPLVRCSSIGIYAHTGTSNNAKSCQRIPMEAMASAPFPCYLRRPWEGGCGLPVRTPDAVRRRLAVRSALGARGRVTHVFILPCHTKVTQRSPTRIFLGDWYDREVTASKQLNVSEGGGTRTHDLGIKRASSPDSLRSSQIH
jgi:hypothetical protein